jgi:hypothetical protein
MIIERGTIGESAQTEVAKGRHRSAADEQWDRTEGALTKVEAVATVRGDDRCPKQASSILRPTRASGGRC